MSYCDYIKKLEKDNLHRIYHDTQYGFRIEDDNELFCRLMLEINQAGLSWNIILNKEQNFRKAFNNFDISTVANFGEEDRIRLLGFALSENLKIFPEIATAIIHLSEANMNKFQLQKGDTEGLVNFPLSIATVRLAILLKEKEGQIRISFRSKGNFSVNEFARKHYNGGGHTNAAGGISNLKIEETIKDIVKNLKKYKQEIIQEE